MDPTVTVTTPPPATTDYLISISSNTDSWGQHLSNHASTASPSIKLRLMCSYGGHILPRPHDKSLCYVGGETRMVVVDRQTTLLDLTHRLSKTLLRSSSSSTETSTAPSSFTLKYQLPSEDLDSLISVTTDEDLENMIEEYERLNSSSAVSKSSRLRLFIFPTKPESVSSIGSFLENSSKSEDWFLNALNGTSSGFSDTSSVNCLLGLEDEISLPEKKDVNHKGIMGTNLKGNNSGQDVHSIPDSPMMETTSSFGSASSTPSLPNLPPIKVNMDDQPKVVSGGIEEQFSQITVQQRHHKHQDDGGFIPQPAPVMVSGSPMSSATPIPEHSDPFLSYQERSDQGFQMAYLKHHHHQQHCQQKQSPGFDLVSGDSVLSDGNKSRAAVPNDTTPMMQQQQKQKLQNSAYLLSMPPTQIDKQNPQLQHQQLEFIQTAVPPPQYIHHHHPSGVIPATSYYQMYPPMDQQNFLYYMPATQPLQGYNFPLQQKQPGNAEPSLATKTELATGVYRATNPVAPQLIRVQSNPQHIRYSEIHNPSQTVASSVGSGGNYGYELADSLQQGQQIYYAIQPVPPLSAAQSQTMTSTTPVKPSSQQQIRTAQP